MVWEGVEVGRRRKKEGGARAKADVRGEESSHMHRDGGGDDDDDTIWSFAPEACDNITATCYVLHGRRHAWQLLTPTRRERNHRHTSERRRASEHVPKWKRVGRVDRWVAGWLAAAGGGSGGRGARIGRLRKRMAVAAFLPKWRG